MVKKSQLVAQNPLIIRAHRLMEAFAKSDDERDFYLDRLEGFMIYVDLDKDVDELALLEEELKTHAERYCLIPKLTFYETKKIMEGFVNEKVYDIDTKEKLLDIIQSKEARENFLEFIYDHLTELEKWQQFYQERSRIRIIEWLRQNDFNFVFEEDLDLTKNVIEKLKKSLFDSNAPKDVVNARKLLVAKAKTYYSNEALNPRPKRGRPPKQTAKVEVEPQMTLDHYQTVPTPAQPFLFKPDITRASSVTFSAKFDSADELLASLKHQEPTEHQRALDNLNRRLASLRNLSTKWADIQDDEDEEELDTSSNHYPTNGTHRPKDKLPIVTKSASAPPKPRGRPRKVESEPVEETEVSEEDKKPRKLKPLRKTTPKSAAEPPAKVKKRRLKRQDPKKS